MTSPIEWTWIWANSVWLWETGRPGVLQTIWLQSIRDDLVTEQQHQHFSAIKKNKVLKGILFTNIIFYSKYTLLLFSCLIMSDSLWPCGLLYARHPCPSATPRACSNSYATSRWCYSTISSSVFPFSSCLRSFPASGSFLLCQLFASGGQNIRASASTSVLLMNIQDSFPLGFTGLISLQSNWSSRVISNTTAQQNQFFNAQLPSLSNSHIHTWLVEKP